MIFCAVFLIGFSTLAFEVLLTRIFSIGNPHRSVYINNYSVIYHPEQPSARLFQAAR
jgi:hypothetical protein